MKKTILLATITLAIATFIGCKKDDTTTTTPTTCTFNNTSLVGTWKFTNVKDSTGVDILDKVDNCIIDAYRKFSIDSMTNSGCNNGNISIFKYNTANINSKNYLIIGNDSLELLNFDCTKYTQKIFLNRTGRFVGTAYYTFTKQ
jgi:hypothetical protein